MTNSQGVFYPKQPAACITQELDTLELRNLKERYPEIPMPGDACNATIIAEPNCLVHVVWNCFITREQLKAFAPGIYSRITE